MAASTGVAIIEAGAVPLLCELLHDLNRVVREEAAHVLRALVASREHHAALVGAGRAAGLLVAVARDGGAWAKESALGLLAALARDGDDATAATVATADGARRRGRAALVRRRGRRRRGRGALGRRRARARARARGRDARARRARAGRRHAAALARAGAVPLVVALLRDGGGEPRARGRARRGARARRRERARP